MAVEPKIVTDCLWLEQHNIQQNFVTHNENEITQLLKKNFLVELKKH